MKKSTVAMAIASALGLTHHPLYATIALGLVLLGALGIATAHAAETWTATGFIV